MEILREVYDIYVAKRFEIEEEMKVYQKKRTEAERMNDLSENQDYDEAIKKLSELYAEHSKIVRLVARAKVVDLKLRSNVINVGTLFNLEVEHPGVIITKDRVSEEGEPYLWYDEGRDVTIFKHNVVFGCPDDNFVDRFILSTETDLARFLIGKTLGTYTHMTKQGTYLKLIVGSSDQVE